MTAVDERTLAVRLAYPVENFPALTALPVFMPCNEKFFTETAGRYGLERSTLLGNGPFVIDGKYGWDAGKYINVKGSSSYRGEAGAWPSNIKFYIGSQDIDTSNPLRASGRNSRCNPPAVRAGRGRGAGRVRRNCL